MKEIFKGLWKLVLGIGGLAIGGLLIIAFLGMFDDKAEKIGNTDIHKGNDTKSAFGDGKDQDDIKENEKAVGQVTETDIVANNTGIDAVLPGDPDYEKYIHVGYTYKLENDGTMEILDVDYGYGIVYVLVEFTSGKDEALQYDQYNATLYIDDYEVPIGVGENNAINNGYIFVAEGTSYSTQANVNPGGRKAKMVFVADIPDDISETSEVEFDVNGGIFKINPLTTEQAKRNTNKVMGIPNEEEYQAIPGKFSMMGNRLGGENIVNISSDVDGNYYINISCLEGDETVLVFDGTLKENGESYIADSYDEDEEVAFLVNFDTNNRTLGIRFYTAPTSNSEEAEIHMNEMNLINGTYTLVEEYSNATNQQYNNQTSTSSESVTRILYGVYHQIPNSIGGKNLAYVEFYTDDSEETLDVMHIDRYESEAGEKVRDLGGILYKDGDGYNLYDGAMRQIYARVIFVDGGMNVEVMNIEDYRSNYNDDLESFAGYYQLESKLDLDSVG